MGARLVTLLLLCSACALAACDTSAIGIVSPRDGARFDGCGEITFSGYAVQAPDGILGGSSLAWSSSLDGLLQKGSKFTWQSLSPGAHVITLTATGKSGEPLTAAVTITVEDPGAPKSFSGVAVDPYIVGATFYEDRDNNGQCDAGEQESSATGDDGRFGFPDGVSACSTIRMKEKGTHVGLPYSGQLKARAAAGPAAGPQVVSPLTTLLANGWTKDQLVGVLRLAGVPGITWKSLERDPMAGLGSLDARRLADGSLALITGTLAVGVTVQIIDGILAAQPVAGLPLSGYDITYAQLREADELFALFLRVGGLLVNIVSYGQIRQAVENIGAGTLDCLVAGLGLPPLVTAEIFIRSAVVTGNFLIEKLSKNLAYMPADYQIGGWMLDLAENFYVMRYKDNTCVGQLVESSLLPDAAEFTTCGINAETEQVECF